MAQPKNKKELIRKLVNRMDEVATYRAARWLGQLNELAQHSAKDQLVQRMEEIPEDLATQWLKELDARLCWQRYHEKQDDFCFGVGFNDCEECQTPEGHEICPNYEFCKAESEAEWPEEKA